MECGSFLISLFVIVFMAIVSCTIILDGVRVECEKGVEDNRLVLFI